jgi:hypothetical protein
MNDDNNKASEKLQKLGKRLRNAHSMNSITSDLQQAVRGAVIEQYAKETGKPVKELREQVEKELQLDVPLPAPVPEEKPHNKKL